MQLLPAEKYAIQAIPGAEMVWFGRLERGMVWETRTWYGRLERGMVWETRTWYGLGDYRTWYGLGDPQKKDSNRIIFVCPCSHNKNYPANPVRLI